MNVVGPKKIAEDIYLVGGSNLTDQRDCSIYLIDVGDELILIDAGAGLSVDKIALNIDRLGLNSSKLSTLILTHCHIDHVGGAAEIKCNFGVKIFMHTLDADVVKKGDRKTTGADWYGVSFNPLLIDEELREEEDPLYVRGQEIVCLHTPGHTPGSISVYLDRKGKRTLFGQDIHGPFLDEFGANMKHWGQSMKKLLALKADILCEGHFGVYEPNSEVTAYIERYIEEYGEE